MRRRLALAGPAVAALFLAALLLSGASAALAGALPEARLLQVALYGGVLFLLFHVVDAPLAFYGGHVLPHRFGLSTRSLNGWLTDQVKAGLLGLGLALVALEALYGLMDAAPETWWLWFALFLFLFSGLLSHLAPILLVPIFFRLQPLPEGELRQRLLALVQRAALPVRELYTIDLSRRTRAGNAAVMGLGPTRRVVLGDTMLHDYSPAEVESVVAHELGHVRHGDVWRFLVIGALFWLASLGATNAILGPLVSLAGFPSAAEIAAFPLLALVIGGWATLLGPLQMALSRRAEAAADAYSLALTDNPEAFMGAMQRLGQQNLEDPDPPRWAVWLLYSHPPVRDRVAMADLAPGPSPARGEEVG